jgi:hypothetical protein
MQIAEANLRNTKPHRQKAERANFARGKYLPQIKKPFSKIKKRPDTEEISA